MSKTHILYNPLAGHGRGKENISELCERNSGANVVSMLEIDDYRKFFAQLEADDTVIICGGDGTVNKFVNSTKGIVMPENLYYFATGSGNDLLRDIGSGAAEPVKLGEYIKNLPVVTVNGEEHLFLNGIGYGIDGYCCAVGDDLRESSDKPINYTSIAIKGLLFHYKPTGATITVDGKEYRFKKVWLAPAMNGRYYGGGMMPTPNQQRLGSERELSVMVMHGSGKLNTLMIFPSIFKGEHVRHKKHVSVLTGNDITVRFDKPRDLQIDGETVRGVTEYTVRARTAVTA